jgi:tyrosinase
MPQARAEHEEMGKTVATVQTTKVKLTNNTASGGNFWIAHHANSNPGLKMLPPPPQALLHATFPQSMAYCFALAPNQTIEFPVESEVGHDAVMDYWYIGFSWAQSNLCVLDASTMLLPKWALKIGDNTEFGIGVGSEAGTYQIFMSTHYGGGQQSGISIVKPVTRRGLDPWPTIRQNAATFSGGFRQGYVEAMKKLKSTPSQLQPPTNSRYDDYVLVHMLAMNSISFKAGKPKIIDNNAINIGAQRDPMWAHERPLFIPWHRVFLRQFELDYQQAWGGFLGIPYWDWTVNAGTNAVPWTDDFMGSGLPQGAVVSGPFAGANQWKITLSQHTDGPDYLVRGLGQGTKTLPTFVDEVRTLTALPYDAAGWNSQAQPSFRNALEGWYSASGSPTPAMHNRAHTWVGGADDPPGSGKGQMLWSDSPNDPVFYIHHSNIDRLWVVWQQMNTDTTYPYLPQVPFYLPSDPVRGNPGIGSKEAMIFMDTNIATQPWEGTTTPFDVVSHYALNYCYDVELPSATLTALATMKMPL